MRRLRNLLEGLPAQARLHQEDPRTPWLMQDELMAQLIETVSVFAAERKLEKPIRIPRPGEDKKKAQAPTSKHGGLFAAAMKKQGVAVA